MAVNKQKQAPTEPLDALQFTPLVSILPIQSSMYILSLVIYRIGPTDVIGIFMC